ncbi:protein translocase subunit SecD [Flavobacteriales bacterium]|nr:protein translocase subunit SecD [Flavobacteriales bacterium]
MKSRKPILFLTIAFALVCIYHLSFTWKVNSIDKKKVEYAKTQLEKNKKDALLSISEEDIENDLRKGKINQEFINDLEINDTSYSNKNIVFELDSTTYYECKNNSLQLTDNPTKIKWDIENGDSISTIILNEGYAIYNVSDIDVDSVELKHKFTEDSLAIENDFAINKTLKLSELEKDYIKSISYENGEDKGVYNLFFKNYTYQECLDKQINLGLDLKGGISATLEIDIRDVLENWAEARSSQYANFISKLDATDERTKNEGSVDYLDLVRDEYGDKLDEKDDLSNVFYGLSEDIKGSTNEEVIEILRNKLKDDIISTTFETIKERTERFANIRANILKTPVAGRFIVELPGAKKEDLDRVNTILTAPAKLEFWEAYKFNEVIAEVSGNNKIKFYKETTEDNIIKWNSIVYLNEPIGADKFRISGDGAVIGHCKIQDSTALRKLFEKLEKSLTNIKFATGYYNKDQERQTLQIYALKTSPIYTDENTEDAGGAVLSGDAQKSIISSSDFGLQDGEWEVTMTMESWAATKWSAITDANKPKNVNGNTVYSFVAVVLDGTVRSCPTINAKIDGGTSSISGSFTSNEAKDLANILSSGKLKSKLKIVQQSVVGPSLGQASIDSSVKSFLYALLVVLLYMIFYYYGAGVVSNVALIANLFFIFGVLASTGLVLTLPGIAGIVLTIGMSVDANVLIYERIREEISNGKGIRLAIEDGYKSAYSSIIDANVTTLLVGIILLQFGEGPIKGFATTLIIGILTSLFCAIFITRLIISSRLNKGKSISFSTKLTKGAFKNLNIDFIGKRKVFYVLSAIVILFGGYSLSTKGLDYGIDFSGGRTYVVNMPNEDITNKDIKESLSKVFVNEDGSEQEIEVSKFNDLTDKDSLNQKRAVNAVKITTKYMIDSEDSHADSIVTSTLLNSLNGLDSNFTFTEKDNIHSYQKVASTIADDIRSSAWESIIFSLLAIFLYIFIRFKKWQFSLGAVVAVFHDVLIVLSVFSIFYGILPFALEIDQAFVAAILTIIGYSLNDTVVVFDRVREYMNDNKKKQVHEFINQSLNSTLSRTINTSITTFFVLLVIFLFGGEVIKGFMFALMVGVIVGTYSSLFVASPIMVDTIKRREIKNK